MRFISSLFTIKTAESSVVVSPLKIIFISDGVNDGQFDSTILVRPLDIAFFDYDPRFIIRETRLNDFNHFSLHLLILSYFFLIFSSAKNHLDFPKSNS